MCLHGALSSIPFNLICEIAIFREKKSFDLLTTKPGAEGMCKVQTVCKGYQETTKVSPSVKRVKHIHIGLDKQNVLAYNCEYFLTHQF